MAVTIPNSGWVQARLKALRIRNFLVSDTAPDALNPCCSQAGQARAPARIQPRMLSALVALRPDKRVIR